MNLLINKFLDRKIPCGMRFGLTGKIDENVYKDLAWYAKQAEVFDFGQLYLEPAEGRPGLYHIPELTDEEEEWFDLGLIPFPAPFCVFEHRLNNDRFAIIVDASKPKVTRVTRFHELMADGVWVKYPGTGLTNAAAKQLNVPLGTTPSGVPITKRGSFHTTDASVWSASLDDKQLLDIAKTLEEPLLSGHISMAKYMALMINSRTTMIRPSDPVPEKLVAARRRNMKSEIRPHHIVTIVPEHLARAASSPGNGLHAPRCLHWRRSHLRRYEHATPRGVWLDDPGHREPGYYVVIPRQLIGLRDMAEIVPHTYRVKGSTNARP